MGRSHRRMSSIEAVGVAADRSRDELFVRPRHAVRGGSSLFGTKTANGVGQSALRADILDYSAYRAKHLTAEGL